jgi:hypothetical protein
MRVRGCIPSKALLFLAEVLHDSRGSRRWASNLPTLKLMWTGSGSGRTAWSTTWRTASLRFARGGGAAYTGTGDLRKLPGSAASGFRDEQDQVSQRRGGHRFLFEPFPDLSFEKGSRIMDSAGALELYDIPERLLIIGGDMWRWRWGRSMPYWAAR